MPKAYVIVDINVTDPEKYEGYRVLAGPAVEAAGGRYLARGGTTAVLEGDRIPNRIVLLEFPDLDAARAWSTAAVRRARRSYRRGGRAAKCARGGAVGSLIAVEGVLKLWSTADGAP